MRSVQRIFFLLIVCVFCLSVNAFAEPLDFSNLAERCGPAVVNIGTERKSVTSGPEDFFGEMFRNLPPGFERFFGFDGGQQPRRRPQSRSQKSLGSGFLISQDGYIVTNYHVVADASSISVTLDNGKGKGETIVAQLIGADEETDLALLKIAAKRTLPYLEFGNSDTLRVGEWLLAIGNPFGLDHTVTAGILSAKGRDIKSGPFDNFLQTDASINPGNSGGPLLNMQGKVVGINTAIIASGQGIGFAIPASMASRIISDIREGRKVSRGWLGVQIQEIDENLAKAIGLTEARGALVGQVMPGEPAEKAGMRDGDVIVSVDGKAIEDTSDLLRTIAGRAPGETVTLTVWRGGKTLQIRVVLGQRVSQSAHADTKRGNTQGSVERLGLSLRPVTQAERREHNVAQGEGLMILAVSEGSPAEEADLRRGDIVLQANMRSVGDVQTLTRIVQEEGLPRGVLALKIRRGGSTFFRTLQLK
ncbi:MAG: DegQ family serine endoprotease [Desulfovibrionaceae bacterium]|nr:DegQ family serine endoprotease [Desulfovibrionaceae bacterium]